MDIVRQIPLRKDYLDQLDPAEIDILLVDLDEDAELRVDDLYEWLNEWDLPVLFNESIATERSLEEGDQEFGRKLTLKLISLLPEFSPPSPWQH
ncbi:MAG: hypothetical protein ABR544_01190 [Gammaproteobacteria bacterium]